MASSPSAIVLPSATASVSSQPVRANPIRRFFRQLLATRLVPAGMLVLGVVLFCAVFADLISPYPPNLQDYTQLTMPPSSRHLLGTDDIGRDVLSRVIYGSRVSLQVGMIAVGIALTFGVSFGLAAGYLGGPAGTLIMRLMDSIQAFPSLILALAITAALGPSIGNAMIAIGITTMPLIARLTRGQTLSVREREYVTASRVLGASSVRIIVRHVFPNITSPIIVQATLLVAGAIVTEAALSFLGVGARPPTATWGSMLRSGSQLLEAAPWLAFAPGIAIFATVLAFNLIGDGLRRALDPRLQRRQHS
ncbi:MAG: ABC transporter permease [Chloroflexota bacterium]